MVTLNASVGSAQSVATQVPDAEITDVPDRMARTSQAEYPGSRRKAIGITSMASPENCGVLQRQVPVNRNSSVRPATSLRQRPPSISVTTGFVATVDIPWHSDVDAPLSPAQLATATKMPMQVARRSPGDVFTEYLIE
jgi:hypothetical protein